MLAEFRERLAPYLYAAQHPGSYSYFTPPPLPMAIVAETLAAWTNQGIDLWLAGMAAPFVEEEVTRWLCDLTGYGDGAWGILASGGVMANVMGLTVARDVHLAKLLGLDAPPRGAQLEGVRIYASDQAHFSIARGLDMLGFPEATLRVLPSDDRFRLRAETGRRGDRRGSRGGAHAVLHRAGRRLDEHGLGRPGRSSWRTWPSGKGCGSTWTPRTAARCACRRATPAA